MKRILLSLVLFAVTGCVAKNEVLTKSEWDEDYGRRASGGVVFSLPQARLRFDYVLNRKTFRAGALTHVVDYCAEGNVNGAQAARVCGLLDEAGIQKSLRFSDPEHRLCAADGSDEETRIVLAEGATLTTDFVPDPAATYVIPLQRSYFQNFEVGLELNANGTVGKGSLTTENLGTQEFLSAFADLAGKFLGASAGLVAMDERAATRPGDNQLDAAEKALLGLRKLRQARDEIAARNNDVALASRAVQLAALDGRIARIVASFTGEVGAKKEAAGRVHWIPAPTHGKGSPVAADSIAGSHWMDEAFDACGKDKEQMRRLLVVVRTGPRELAPLATGEFDGAAFGRARGWPYRVPQEADIEWQVCDRTTVGGEPPVDPVTVAGQCKRIDGIRQLMPQFGVTLRLPEKTGGRKSAIAPDYYVDGSLKKLTISHVGESPAPVIAAVKTALTPEADMPEPTEVAQLTAEASLINARQALCRLVFSVTATDPLCLGPNPPTTRPESE